MNRFILTIVLCGSAPFVSNAQSPASVAPQPSEKTLEQTLQQVARERILAFDKGNKSLWSQYVADGYAITTPSGKLITKKQTMESFTPPLIGYRDVFGFADVHIQRDGDTAVMSYRINEYEYWDDARYNVPQLLKTDTYVLRNNCWLILASHEGFVPPPHKAVSIDSTTLDNYTGIFRLMRSLTYTITKAGDKLLMQENDKPDKTVLLPQAKDSFFATGDSRQIVFVRGPTGKVNGFLLRDNDYDIRVNKVN